MTGETAFERASARLRPSAWPAFLAFTLLISLAAATVGLLAAREFERAKVAQTRAAKLEFVRKLLDADSPPPTGADVLAVTGEDPIVLHSARSVAREHGLSLARQAEQAAVPEQRRALRREAAHAFQIAEKLGDLDAARLRAECLYPLLEELIAAGKRREAVGACREVAEAYLEAADAYDRSGNPEEARNCRQNAATVAVAIADLEGPSGG